MNIKNEETHRLVRRLAELTGQSQTGAVEDAVRRRLAELDAENDDERRRRSIAQAIARAQAAAAALESRSARSMSAATYLETAIVADRRTNPPLGRALDHLLGAEDVRVAPVTEVQARIARVAYRDFGRGSGHSARLNFGDFSRTRWPPNETSPCSSRVITSTTLTSAARWMRPD